MRPKRRKLVAKKLPKKALKAAKRKLMKYPFLVQHKRKPKMTTAPTKHEAHAAAPADKPHEPTPAEALIAEAKLRLANAAPLTQQFVDELEKLLGGNHKK
jgi:hypothetical protein